jgi:membrane protease YdiL (CAAX protease family)
MQREISFFKLVGLFSGLVAGIIEELAFRRWFMDLIMHQGIGIVPQIIFSGLVFGIAHVSWSLFGHKKKIGIGAAIATTLLGVSLAIVYIIGQRNIGPCIVAHCLISMILEPWIMLAAVSGQWKSVESKE